MIHRLFRALLVVSLKALYWVLERSVCRPPDELLDPEKLQQNYAEVTDWGSVDPTTAWELAFAVDRSAWWIHEETGDAMVVSVDDQLLGARWKLHHTTEESREPGHVVTSDSTLLAVTDTPETALVFATDYMRYGRTE